MTGKLTPDQYRRVAEIEDYIKVVDRVKHLVTELDDNRAAPSKTLAAVCEKIAREMSQLRQRALTSNIGTITDVAGAMAVMAARGGGIAMKIRGLADGVNSLQMQLDVALKAASTPDPKARGDKPA
jgi:hypothetical protein